MVRSINIKILIIISLIFLLTKNSVFCEPVPVEINPQVLEEIKGGIYNCLIELMKTSEFKNQFNNGPFFYLNYSYIMDFTDNLPLTNILYKYRYQTPDALYTEICKLFLEALSRDKESFEWKIKLFANLLLTGKTFITYLEFDGALNALIERFQIHPGSTENIGIITDGFFDHALILIKHKNTVWENLKYLPVGFGITLEGNNFNDLPIITFRYYILFDQISIHVTGQI